MLLCGTGSFEKQRQGNGGSFEPFVRHGDITAQELGRDNRRRCLRRNALLFRSPAALAFFESANHTTGKKKNAGTPGAGLHCGKSSARAPCSCQKRCGCFALLQSAPRLAGAEGRRPFFQKRGGVTPFVGTCFSLVAAGAGKCFTWNSGEGGGAKKFLQFAKNTCKEKRQMI